MQLIVSAGLILAILGMALKARRRQQVAGDSGLVGSLVAVAAVQAEDPCQNRRWCRFCSEPWRVSARSSNRRSNAPWSALQW